MPGLSILNGFAALCSVLKLRIFVVPKVSRPEMDTFSSAPTSPRMRSTQLVQDDYQFQFVAVCL